MAKPGLTQVTTSDTFQEWLNRTNELVDIVKTDVITASTTGDTTSGNATLVGAFTASTIIASNTFRTDAISPKVGSTEVGVTSPLNINTPVQVVQNLESSNAPRVNYSNGSIIWRVGFESNAETNFIIDAGTGTRKLSLSPSGNLTVAGTINGVNSTAFAALNGVTSNIQTQLNNKQPLDVELTALSTLTSSANKIPMFSGTGTATLLDFRNENNMSSNSSTSVASQSSIKKYVDDSVLNLNKFFIVRERTLSGVSRDLTADNSSGDSGWAVLKMNDLRRNNITGASLDLSTSWNIILPVGIYKVNASAVGGGGSSFNIRLMDLTLNRVLAAGTSLRCGNDEHGMTMIDSVFTVTVTTTIQLQQTNNRSSRTSSGIENIYSTLSLQKIAG